MQQQTTFYNTHLFGWFGCLKSSGFLGEWKETAVKEQKVRRTECGCGTQIIVLPRLLCFHNRWKPLLKLKNRLRLIAQPYQYVTNVLRCLRVPFRTGPICICLMGNLETWLKTLFLSLWNHYFCDSIYWSGCSEITDFIVNFMSWLPGCIFACKQTYIGHIFTFDRWGLILGGVQHFFKSLWKREENETPFPEVRQLAFILHSSMWLALCPCWLTREPLPGYRQSEKKDMSSWV